MNMQFAQASTVAAIPTNSTSSEPAKSSEKVIDPAARFDGRMHGHIKMADTKDRWIELGAMLLNAHRNTNLRPGVRNHFLKDCPHEDVCQNFKTAIGYVDPEEKKRAAELKRKQEQAAADDRFDERMVGRMKAGAWSEVQEILLLARRHGNLRAGVRNSFLLHCPEPYVADFYEATRDFGPAPIRPVRLTRAQQEARRAASRAARTAAMPQKGKAGQKSEPQGKKGKKK